MSGFCTQFCGWHSYNSGSKIKYGWIGIPKTGCNCWSQQTSPNGDPATDSAISVIAHELAEAATDPTGGGWCYTAAATSCFSSSSVENADQCAWNFPNAIFSGNSYYNLQVGAMKYLIQSNWNLMSKKCAMS